MQNQVEIIPGGGLTLYVGSDKYPYTIISYENKILKIQQDIANSNTNEFSPNINGYVRYLKKYSKNNIDNWFRVELNQQTGRFNKKNRVLVKFGEREYFLDPSF